MPVLRNYEGTPEVDLSAIQLAYDDDREMSPAEVFYFNYDSARYYNNNYSQDVLVVNLHLRIKQNQWYNFIAIRSVLDVTIIIGYSQEGMK